MLSALFSALAGACGVRDLEVLDRESSESVPSREGELLVRRPRGPETDEERNADDAFWHWMGCVLFQESVNSAPPLESISLLSVCIPARVNTLFARYKTGTVHPLIALAMKAVADFASAITSPQGISITLPPGIKVTFHSTINQDTTTLTTPGPIPATIIHHDPRESPLPILLIPGLGICSVDASLLPLKRRRVESEAPHSLRLTPWIRNFVIFRRRGRVQDGSMLEAFLELIGDCLEGLGLRIPTLTDLHLREILSRCPTLESLSVGWTSLPSLDFLFAAYESGCRISSLKFTGGELLSQRQHLPRLVEQLSDSTTRASQTLRRLRLTWPIRHKDLLEAIDEMLTHNKLLTHVCFASARHVSQWAVERHHGELLHESPQILEDQTRLSLARVLRHVGRTYPAIQLNDNVQGLIREYAMTMQRRTVVCDSTEDTQGA